MAVPSHDRFIEPELRYLATHRDGARARDVHDAAADALGLTDADRQERLPSGIQPVFKNRAGWAHDRLKRAGLSSCPRRGFWRLTNEGLAFASAHPQPLEPDVLEGLASDFMDVRLRPPHDTDVSTAATSLGPSDPASPDDRLEEALAELRQSVTVEILEALHEASAGFSETVVLDVLHRMGYGTSRSDVRRVGGSGDAGIDGIISLDRLGLEKVYVQAKRWQQAVGRPDVQAFYGALAGQRARKGVFITTSTFSAQAVDFANSVESVVLVDGARLAELMIDHEVGVSLRPVRIPKLDSDYFEEESG